MQLTLTRQQAPFEFEIQDGQGHSLYVDGSKEIGGAKAGFRPMELLLAGLASCTSIDVVLILQKQRQEIRDYTVCITGKRAETAPKVFTAIHLTFNLSGAVDLEKAKRAAALSLEKYCSAAAMLGTTANITHEVHVQP